MTLEVIELSTKEQRVSFECWKEYKRATSKFPTFLSDREGFDILDEEVQELKQAIRHGTPQEARAEAIQVAAMALRLLLDCYTLPLEKETNE